MLEKRGWLIKVFFMPSMMVDALPSVLHPMVTMLKTSRPGKLNNRANGLTGSSPSNNTCLSIAISLFLFSGYMVYYSTKYKLYICKWFIYNTHRT